MNNYFVFSLLLLISIITFLYLYIELKKDLELIRRTRLISEFEKQLNQYTGYVICAEKKLILSELRLFRIIMNYISNIESCLLLDLSNNLGDKHIDVNWVEKLKIKVIPSILYIKNGKVIKEIINFSNYSESFSQKEFIQNLKRKLS